jgi:hypothetical protein
MDISAKILSIRHGLGIPANGFPNESEALDWYRDHYEKAKGIPLKSGFGYRFEVTGRRSIQFDDEYDYDSGKLSLNYIPEIDKQVPLDVQALSLALDSGIDPVSAPALRLPILVGYPKESLPLIPSYISAAMGGARLLMHPPSVVTDEMRRQILDEPGPFSTGINQGYLGERENKNMPRYFDVYRAYGDWVAMKKEKERKGTIVSRKGYLKWIAQRLVNEYGWESIPESYTVCRYLDRARKVWGSPFRDE